MCIYNRTYLKIRLLHNKFLLVFHINWNNIFSLMVASNNKPQFQCISIDCYGKWYDISS